MTNEIKPKKAAQEFRFLKDLRQKEISNGDTIETRQKYEAYIKQRDEELYNSRTPQEISALFRESNTPVFRSLLDNSLALSQNNLADSVKNDLEGALNEIDEDILKKIATEIPVTSRITDPIHQEIYNKQKEFYEIAKKLSEGDIRPYINTFVYDDLKQGILALARMQPKVFEKLARSYIHRKEKEYQEMLGDKGKTVSFLNYNISKLPDEQKDQVYLLIGNSIVEDPFKEREKLEKLKELEELEQAA